MEKIIIDLEAKTDKALKEIEKLNKAINETGDSSKKSLKSIDESTKKTAKSTSLLSKGFKGVGLALKGLGLGIVIKVVDRLTEAFSSNQQIVDVMNTAFETVSIVVKQVTDIFSDVFGKVSDATGGFDALGKVLGGALSIAINSIALTIQGITLGIQKARLAWEQSFLGGKDKDTIKELNLSIIETQQNIVETGERIKSSGKQIADNFVEAVGEVGTLTVGVAEAVTETIEKVDIKQAKLDAEKLVRSQKNFELLALQQQRLVEEYDLQAEKQRQIRDDESKSIADRIKANEELGKILLQQNEAEKKTVDARISAVQQEIELKGNTVELSNQLYELQTERIAIDAKVAGFQSEQLTNINSLKREELDLTKAQNESENKLSIEKQRFNAEQIENEVLRLQKLKEIDEAEKEIEQRRLQAIVNEAKDGTQAKIDAQIALDEFMFEAGKTSVERDKQISDAKIKIAQEEERAKVAAVNGYAGALSSISGLIGQETEKGKALAVASSLVNTYSAITGQLKAFSKVPVPGYAIAQAIATGLVGLANVKKIVSVKVPGSSGGGSTQTGSTPATPVPPAFNVVGASGTNQLAEAIGSQSQEPVKAYVVANDVSTAQSMDRNIVEGASI